MHDIFYFVFNSIGILIWGDHVWTSLSHFNWKCYDPPTGISSSWRNSLTFDSTWPAAEAGTLTSMPVSVGDAQPIWVDAAVSDQTVYCRGYAGNDGNLWP